MPRFAACLLLLLVLPSRAEYEIEVYTTSQCSNEPIHSEAGWTNSVCAPMSNDIKTRFGIPFFTTVYAGARELTSTTARVCVKITYDGCVSHLAQGNVVSGCQTVTMDTCTYMEHNGNGNYLKGSIVPPSPSPSPPNPDPPPPTPPPTSPPPDSPPPPPPAVLPSPPPPGAYKVTSAFTLGGDVSDYDGAARQSIKATLAEAVGISIDAVTLTLAEGSVIVNSEIRVPTQADATAKADTLSTGIMASAASLSSALERQFAQDGVPTDALTVEEITITPVGASIDDPTPAVSDNTNDNSMNIIIIIVATAVAVIAVMLIAALIAKLKPKKVALTRAAVPTKSASQRAATATPQAGSSPSINPGGTPGASFAKKFCSQCGKPIDANARFCPGCGNPSGACVSA